jgi:hypothetical protein
MSEKKNEHLINTVYPQLKLNNVNYTDIELSEESLQELKDNILNVESKMKDDYKIRDYNNDYVEIEFTRKKFFEPKVIYEIKVVISVVYDINDEAKKELNLSNLKQECEERREMLLAPVISQASLLIGNLTNINSNDFPTITPPYLITEEDSD